jgi:hypothetical protein
MLLKKNESFLGVFKNDKFHKGKLLISEDIYDGEFKNNLINGEGTY